jgi:signal peptidase I
MLGRMSAGRTLAWVIIAIASAAGPRYRAPSRSMEPTNLIGIYSAD